jgi:Na+-driven multidrug efflux pump
MISMIIWAVINTILDALFIFSFNLWIAWAAYATIISQFITFALNVWYVSKLNTISLSKELFIPELKYVKHIAWLW